MAASDKLLKRFITTLILILFSALVIISRWLSGMVISLLIIIGLYEFFSMIEKKDIYAYKYFGLAVGAIIPISILFKFELTESWELFLVVLALLALILMQLRRGKSSGVINAISTTIFGILYVSWFLSFMIKIRFMNDGVGLLTMLLLTTKLGDIGAYMVGKRFGKKLLIPQVSPHKSIEGAFGGLLFSIMGALASRPFVHYSYWHLMFLGVFLGILAQLGDLSESLIKRDCGVKDSGHLFPGLGGILDLIDSLLFTAPVFYFYMSIILK